MATINQSTTKRYSLLIGGLLCYIICLSILLSLSRYLQDIYQWRNRGVEYPSQAISDVEPALGVNVALEQYDPAALTQVLDRIEAAGLTWVRQRFPWHAIETAPGTYDWARWDAIVDALAARNLHVIAVMETSPAWVRASADANNPLAPPADPADLEAWAQAFVHRYPHLDAYQVWDQPNIAPHWGAREANAAEYVALLEAGYRGIKNVATDARVLSAALAPNQETGGKNLSDLSYLRAMYEAGAQAYMDVVGIKAYGFWSGPLDRRIEPETLNYSRAALIREIMFQYGDEATPVWACEMGWSALPADWSGQPAPWGTDSEVKQAGRTLQAIVRARQEWPWMPIICLHHFQPNVPLDNPIWGLAFFGPDDKPREIYHRLSAFIPSPSSEPLPYQPPLTALRLSLGLVALTVGVVAWRAGRIVRRLPWQWAWRWAQARYAAASDGQRFIVSALALLLYWQAPGVGLSLLGLWLLLIAAYWDPKPAIWYTILLSPLTPLRRTIGTKSFTLAETLLFITLGALALSWLARWVRLPRIPSTRKLEQIVHKWLDEKNWLGLDGTWIFFAAWGAIAAALARHRGVAISEWRTVMLQPLLLYWLISRRASRTAGHLKCYVDALVLSGAVLALVGLAQYLIGGDVIVAEGVRRIRSLYASPNNLALVLVRLTPLAIAMAAWGHDRHRRITYGLAAALMVPCLFLTYSRGAWLLGLPAALLLMGLLHSRRTALIMLVGIIGGVLLLMPLAGTERIASLFDFSRGTSLFRVSLWQSAIAMIRDHPLLGVGPDNFLYYYPDYMLEVAAAEPNLSHPHNILLDAWLRLGIGGILAIIWFTIVIFRSGFSIWTHRLYGNGARDTQAIALGLMASMTGLWAHGLVDNSIFVPELALILSLITAYLWAIQQMEGESE